MACLAPALWSLAYDLHAPEPLERLVYLPPYSPDFNPIELAWSKFKNHLRRVAARTRCALARTIRTGLATITANDAHGFFRHCGYGS